MKKAILFYQDVRQNNFIYLNWIIGDGIFDRIHNEEIIKMIWCFKKKGKSVNNIHEFSGNVVDLIMYKSMAKLSTDNVSAIFIAFKNFENKIKNADFKWEDNPSSCKFIGNEIDYDYKEN